MVICSAAAAELPSPWGSLDLIIASGFEVPPQLFGDGSAVCLQELCDLAHRDVVEAIRSCDTTKVR